MSYHFNGRAWSTKSATSKSTMSIPTKMKSTTISKFIPISLLKSKTFPISTKSRRISKKIRPSESGTKYSNLISTSES